MTDADTIFAPATAPGQAGVAVIRVSGPGAAAAAADLTGSAVPPPRSAVLRTLRGPDGDVIDRGLVLWFPGPNSFTGEDVVEFQVHGGRAVAAALADALIARTPVRPAAPGEFTRRAFLNGRLDLTEAEGLADLVAAETAAQRRQALRQMSGSLGRLYETWRTDLISLLAHAEADIDFPDEDLPDGLAATVRPRVIELRDRIAAHLDDGQRGERLRDGLYVVIVGPPNAGKSSLLNALARRDAAIVSTIAGTTRDVIEVHLDIGGYPVLLADTAGLRRAADAIEGEGVRRALARAAQADLKIVLADATGAGAAGAEVAELIDADSLVALNKVDLAPAAGPVAVAGHPALPISVKTGSGMTTFLSTLEDMVASRLDAGGAPMLTRARHRAALEECHAALQRAVGADATELVAEDLRLAARGLGRITGRVDVEDILDVVFADFCIGK